MLVFRLQVFQATLQGGDNPETVIYLSHQEKNNFRGDLGALEIDHDSSVKSSQITSFRLSPLLSILDTPIS
jgi:hypothetical protein